MSDHFDLIVSVKDHSATFRLLDNSGAQIAYRHTDFTQISLSRQHGLFNLRDYVQLYVAADDEAAAVAEIGVCIAEDVLGQEIFEPLWRAQTPRTLRIQLPGATEQQNPLATDLARVPWEIARPAPNQPTLAQRNLIVRIVNDLHPPASQPLEPASDEALRVLFIFAEARDANPLSLRRERRELMELFEQEIYPQRRVVADILSHGVTRERLEEQIQQNNGYHIVHWSGHGHKNQLLLAKPGGKSDHLSGEELLALFTDAGVFLPRLFFLSACHSGDILTVRDWNDFLAVALGKKTHAAKTRELGAPPATLKDLNLEQPSGYTGTAHALLQGGVPSVVAMRYAVGDDYARELAVEFYRALLAHPQPKDAASALNLARRALLKKHDPAHYTACDHATPLLYGAEQPGLTLNPGRSAALDPRNPRLHHIAELTSAAHRCFVGRTWELAGLGANFIAPGAPQPLAVLTGLGGMGKTALTAEALALWEKHFTWVLLYQAKPNALNLDSTLRDIHQKLNAELGRYHHHIKANPADAIHREADAGFTGDERLARLTRNLIRALRDEAILLVLDNFETNLEAQNNAETAAACQDPAWDRCLSALARELGGAPSRVLITSRRPLAVTESHSPFIAPLGPLPSGEAALYLREHPVLSKMVFGADDAEQTLAQRLLQASRFHPLLMDRLARLAADAGLRPQLMQALATLEASGDYAQLPELFANRSGDAQERAYLNDALAASLDQLIHAAGADARCLLWMIATANEPVALGLLESVWRGEDGQQQQLRQIKQMLEMLPQLPAETQAQLKALPPEFRALLDALPPDNPARPDSAPLLQRLVSVGLATEARRDPEDENPDLGCHELVRERIRAWMERHPQDRAELTEDAIRLAYAERLAATF
ncbi:MAG: CHAT domain-containing protein, partial [Sulfuricellaceae bacterium]